MSSQDPASGPTKGVHNRPIESTACLCHSLGESTCSRLQVDATRRAELARDALRLSVLPYGAKTLGLVGLTEACTIGVCSAWQKLYFVPTEYPSLQEQRNASALAPSGYLRTSRATDHSDGVILRSSQAYGCQAYMARKPSSTLTGSNVSKNASTADTSIDKTRLTAFAAARRITTVFRNDAFLTSPPLPPFLIHSRNKGMSRDVVITDRSILDSALNFLKRERRTFRTRVRFTGRVLSYLAATTPYNSV